MNGLDNINLVLCILLCIIYSNLRNLQCGEESMLQFDPLSQLVKVPGDLASIVESQLMASSHPEVLVEEQAVARSSCFCHITRACMENIGGI